MATRFRAAGPRHPCPLDRIERLVAGWRCARRARGSTRGGASRRLRAVPRAGRGADRPGLPGGEPGSGGARPVESGAPAGMTGAASAGRVGSGRHSMRCEINDAEAGRINRLRWPDGLRIASSRPFRGCAAPSALLRSHGTLLRNPCGCLALRSSPSCVAPASLLRAGVGSFMTIVSRVSTRRWRTSGTHRNKHC